MLERGDRVAVIDVRMADDFGSVPRISCPAARYIDPDRIAEEPQKTCRATSRSPSTASTVSR